LHEQFRNAKALTIMASKLRKVLDIEAADSYIKRPVGPMITVEVQDISRLARFIRIPSMLEGADTANIIRQKILYFGLPNQCRKCCKFGHHAKTCNTNLFRPQEGPVHHNLPLTASSGGASEPSEAAQNSTKKIKSRPPSSVPPEFQEMKGSKLREEVSAATGSPQIPSQPSGQGNPGLEESVQVASTRNQKSKVLSDLEMPDLLESTECPKTESHTEKEHCSAGTFTPNNKPSLGFPAREGPQRATREATSNPFATLGEKGREVRGPSEPPGESMEDWIFQGRKRNAPIWASPIQEPPQALLRSPQRDVTLGGKRGLLDSKVHQSYFTSLGISVPANKEPFRARFWPVLTREKDTQREMLMHSKMHTLSSLPLSIRYTRLADEPEAEWTPNATWTDLIHRIQVELEEQILRFKLNISERPQLEWSWQDELSRGDGMHHPHLHPHGLKRGECSEKEIPTMDSSGAYAQSKQ
jgi:hypothetical protein